MLKLEHLYLGMCQILTLPFSPRNVSGTEAGTSSSRNVYHSNLYFSELLLLMIPHVAHLPKMARLIPLQNHLIQSISQGT
jgi:hypothetical protein